jgi:hypothetical protein
MSFSAADMDDMLADFGCKTVTLSRSISNASVDVRVFFRQTKTTDLALSNATYQQTTTVIISATEIMNSSTWPGATPVGFPGDPRIPTRGDSISIEGRDRAVISAYPIYVDDELVRVNLEVMG